MKILHIINSLQSGGAERLVVDLAYQGNMIGDKVEILTLAKREGIPRDFADRNGITVTELGLWRFDPRAIIHIRRHAKRFDVAHVHLFPSLYWASLSDIPKVYTEHSTSNRRFNRPVLRLLERYAYGSYDHVAAISKGVRSSISEHLDKIRARVRVSIIHNGIRDEFFDWRNQRDEGLPNPNEIRLVCVGSLRSVKNFELAIEAIHLIPNCTLDIIGEGPERDLLQRRIAELGIESRVSLVGAVSNISTRLGRYDALLSTSRHEGFGLVAAEAMALGVPVIGPDIPGFRDIVLNGVTGLLYSKYDAPEIRRLILSLCDDEMHRELASNAKEHGKKFNIGATYSAYREIYDRVISERR